MPAMASTVANLAAVLKDAWTSDRLAKQFYDENPLLDWFTQTSPTMIGAQAQVPIHKGRSGGTTSTGSAGGSLNPADNQKVDQALYTMVYLWRQIQLEVAAINQSGSSAQSIVAAKDFEIGGAINDISRDASRMLANNGDGLICQCAVGGPSATVLLTPQASGGLGFDAIVRGWLYVGLPVDIGTVADSDVIVTGSQIIGVNEDPVAPSITISSSVSTLATHFVSVANPNSITAPSPELNGLRNMVGSTTSILGGLNPATAGNEYWKPASVDATTTSFSLDLMLNINRAVYQKSGRSTTTVLMSSKQMTNFYSLLQNQVRFNGERGMGAGGIGNMDGMSWNGMGVNVWPDIVDKEMYFVTKDDFERITGNIKKPTWTSEIEGGGQGLRWTQGQTNFVEGLVFPLQVGMNRRNRSGAATNLVA
jgi:hypothetical protein